jgi:hypothetical protein
MPTSLSTGLKKKLTIAPCKVDKGTITVDSGKGKTIFEAMINPAGYKRQLSIDYSKQKTLGQSSTDPMFSAICPEVLTLDNLVLDGTGVVTLIGLQNVKDMIDNLLKVIYVYEGDKHEPNHVRLVWGSLIFFGRAQSISIDYTMFKHDGTPLRAKVSLSFLGWMSKKEGELTANLSSPDLSHLVEVRAGDTLPLLCNSIYNDSAYYREVARVNNLTNFRNLEPGLVLRFPPLA